MTILSMIIGLAALATSGPADDASPADSRAIKAAVYDYFDGQTERSEQRLSRAFAVDHAMMTWVQTADDGAESVTSMPILEVIPRWAEGEPSDEARDSEIISMSVVDGRIATVMFDSDGRFYDALTLAKVNGEWKIISKAFVRQ